MSLAMDSEMIAYCCFLRSSVTNMVGSVSLVKFQIIIKIITRGSSSPTRWVSCSMLHF